MLWTSWTAKHLMTSGSRISWDCFHACIATHLKMFWVKPFPLFSMAVSEARGWPNLTESCGFLCGDRVIPGSWGKKAHGVSQARSSKKMVDSNKIRSKTLIFLLVWDPAVCFFWLLPTYLLVLKAKQFSPGCRQRGFAALNIHGFFPAAKLHQWSWT